MEKTALFEQKGMLLSISIYSNYISIRKHFFHIGWCSDARNG